MSKPDPDLEPAEAFRAELEAELEAELAADFADLELEDHDDDPITERDDGVDGPELTIALSPRQILGGFALLAAIVVWLFRRRKT
jgi:hypothetical protein